MVNLRGIPGGSLKAVTLWSIKGGFPMVNKKGFPNDL